MEDLDGRCSDGRHRPDASLDTCSSFCTFVIVMTLHIAICDIVKDIIKGQSTRFPVLIAYAQMPLINTHAVQTSKARGLKLCPYFIHASSECSGESEHMRRLTLAFAAC